MISTVLTYSITQKKEIKVNGLGRKEVKPLLFADYVIITKSIHQCLELSRERLTEPRSPYKNQWYPSTPVITKKKIKGN